MLLKGVARGMLFGLAFLATSSTAVGGNARDPEASDAAVTPYVGSGEPGSGSSEFRLSYYRNADSGDGNPFVNEKLSVVEPILIVNYDISDRLSTWGQVVYDNVSSASIKRLSKFQNQSGASGDNYFGVTLGSHYELDENRRIGGFVTGSVEYDYKSFGFGGDFARDFAGKDATVKISTNGYYDILDVIRFNGDSQGSDHRLSYSTTLSWYQILNPRIHAELGATFGYQNGFLETPYNAVVIEDPTVSPNPHLANLARGTEVTEELPGTRLRGSLFGRTRYSLFPGTALELGGRFYVDNWGITSFSAKPFVNHWFNDRIGLRLGYRYYSQTAANDFANHFTSISARRTQDPDLAKFHSHGINSSLRWQLTDTLGLDLNAGYTIRQDGINELILGFGIKKLFGGESKGGSIWGH